MIYKLFDVKYKFIKYVSLYCVDTNNHNYNGADLLKSIKHIKELKHVESCYQQLIPKSWIQCFINNQVAFMLNRIDNTSKDYSKPFKYTDADRRSAFSYYTISTII